VTMDRTMASLTAAVASEAQRTVRVAEIMTSPALTLDPDTPIETAAARLFRHRVAAMPVVENGALIGIVGEADLYRAAAAVRGVPLGGTVPFDAHGHPRTVSDLMRRGVLWVKASDSVRLAAQLLMRHARSLPVLDRGRVVGMVTRRDVVASLARNSKIDLVRLAASTRSAPRTALATHAADSVATSASAEEFASARS
jgi:CBS domain-containing protein